MAAEARLPTATVRLTPIEVVVSIGCLRPLVWATRAFRPNPSIDGKAGLTFGGTIERVKHLMGVKPCAHGLEAVPPWIHGAQISNVLSLMEFAPMSSGAQPLHDILKGIEDRELDRLIYHPPCVEQNRVIACVRPKIGLFGALQKLYFHNPAGVQPYEIRTPQLLDRHRRSRSGDAILHRH